MLSESWTAVFHKEMAQVQLRTLCTGMQFKVYQRIERQANEFIFGLLLADARAATDNFVQNNL